MVGLQNYRNHLKNNAKQQDNLRLEPYSLKPQTNSSSTSQEWHNLDQKIFSYKVSLKWYSQIVLIASSLSLAEPQNLLQVALLDGKACEFQEVYPILRRMAENSCTSSPEVDGGHHDKRCCSGRTSGRYCQASKAQSDHQQF